MSEIVKVSKVELLDWIDDLIVDAGVDKPYEMDEREKQAYYKILDILEEYFSERNSKSKS